MRLPQPSKRRMRRFLNGGWCRRRSAASWSGCLAKNLRGNKAALGRLVSIEVGKIVSEGLGEVQEMIDICDFAVGLSRQLYGLTIATERGEHRMMETWHPLGVTGIISAFNFPVAVWSWNAALALVCGNSIVWKPSEKTPLTALAAQALFERALSAFQGRWRHGAGGPLDGADRRPRDRRGPRRSSRACALVSATGSTAMGRAVGPRLASASPARSWSSAATTRRSSRRPPIST